MTRAEYDRLWKEYERANDDVATSACAYLHFLHTDVEPIALGRLAGTVMRFKLLQADLPHNSGQEVTP